MEVGHQHQLFREVLLLLLSSPTADQDCAQPVIQLFQALGRKRLRQFRLQHPDDLAEELEDCGRLFEVKGNGVVTPKTSLTICRLHSNESGSCPENTCPDLHLCAFFLLSGQCAYGSHCLFGHELRTAHNRKLLERHLLAGLPITELRTLFCLPSVRQGVTLPKVCRFYNKIRGCSRGADCHSLHLCSYYVTGDCKFGKRCERNHNIDDPQVTRVMSLYGVKVNRNLSEVLQEVRTYNRRNEQEKDLHGMEFNGRSPHRRGARTRYGSVPTPCRGFSMAPSPQHDGSVERAAKRARNASESSCSSSNSKLEEICLFSLKGVCHYGDNCRKLHSQVPYLWRVRPAAEEERRERGSGERFSGVGGELEDGELGEDNGWRSVPSLANQQLETAFSKPHETDCVVTDESGDKLKVDFRSMSAESVCGQQLWSVRRVGTMSGEDPSLKHWDLSVATVYLWYWRNPDGIWQEFGKEKNGTKLPVTSQQVESHYAQTRAETFRFGEFSLDFGKNRLRSLATDRKYKVRQRPTLWTPSQGPDPTKAAADADTHMGSTDSRGHDSGPGAVGLHPELWRFSRGSAPKAVVTASSGGKYHHWSTRNGSDLRASGLLAAAASSAAETNRSCPNNTSDKNGNAIIKDDDDNDDDDDEDGKDDEARATKERDIIQGELLVPMYGNNGEFRSVKRQFTTTLGVACKILGISKVVNPSLKAFYKRTKTTMQRQLKQKQKQGSSLKGKLQQLKLYYGPPSGDDISAIYISGLDPNILKVKDDTTTTATMTTTTHGQAPGWQLHVNAARAHRDMGSQSRGREKHMFVMRCLVADTMGESVPGERMSKRERERVDPYVRRQPGKSNVCLVDDADDPKTFTVYNAAQLCPIYLISFQLA